MNSIGEKLFQRISSASDAVEIQTLLSVATDRWLSDAITEEEYQKIMEQGKTRLATPATDVGVCIRCGATLSNYQMMMHEKMCTECSRRARDRGL